jgi:hypothetical protein
MFSWTDSSKLLTVFVSKFLLLILSVPEVLWHHIVLLADTIVLEELTASVIRVVPFLWIAHGSNSSTQWYKVPFHNKNCCFILIWHTSLLVLRRAIFLLPHPQRGSFHTFLSSVTFMLAVLLFYHSLTLIRVSSCFCVLGGPNKGYFPHPVALIRAVSYFPVPSGRNKGCLATGSVQSFIFISKLFHDL